MRCVQTAAAQCNVIEDARCLCAGWSLWRAAAAGALRPTATGGSASRPPLERSCSLRMPARHAALQLRTAAASPPPAAWATCRPGCCCTSCASSPTRWPAGCELSTVPFAISSTAVPVSPYPPTLLFQPHDVSCGPCSALLCYAVHVLLPNVVHYRRLCLPQTVTFACIICRSAPVCMSRNHPA